MRYRLILFIASAWVIVDQATKWLANQYIRLDQGIELTSFFTLVNVRNRGAAFGFLNDPSITWQFWLFLGATCLAVGAIFFVARGAAKTDMALFAGLGCIMGGAVGNAIDRVRFRAVVDFLDIHYAGWHWPAFNVADIAICIGAGLTALLILRSPGPEKRNGD